MSDDEMAAADLPPTPADTPPSTPATGRPAPPPIAWETEVSTRNEESESLGKAVLDVVRMVIHGQRGD